MMRDTEKKGLGFQAGLDTLEPTGDTLTSCYALYAERLTRQAMRFTADSDVAEDMVQETFIKAYELRAFADGRKPHLGWLLKVCDRICLDSLRRETCRRSAQHLALRNSGAVQSDVDLEDCEDLYTDYLDAATDIVVGLSAKRRQIAILHFFCGKSAAEIARDLAIKPNTVWTRLYEIRTLLRRGMAPGHWSRFTRSVHTAVDTRAEMKRWGESFLTGLLSRDG